MSLVRLHIGRYVVSIGHDDDAARQAPEVPLPVLAAIVDKESPGGPVYISSWQSVPVDDIVRLHEYLSLILPAIRRPGT